MRASLAAFVLGLVLATLAWTAIFVAEAGMPTWQSQWTYDLYQEKTRALAAIPGPRLVAVGGSSVTFGVRADVLARELGVAAYNFGSHAGLDVAYVLHRAEGVLRPGDTVLLIIEYELYIRDPSQVDPFLLDYVLARDPGYVRDLEMRSLVPAVMRLSLERAWKPWKERGKAAPVPRPFDVYSSDHLDAYGDTLGNNPALKRPGTVAALERMPNGTIGSRAGNLEVVGQFLDWCKRHQVRVIAAAPPMMDATVKRTPGLQAEADYIVRWYRERGVPMALEPFEALYPPNEFFDSRYHLDHLGAARYSHDLAGRLRPLLAPGPAAAPAIAPRATALDRFSRRFSGWAPVSGLAGFEGPYPKPGMEAVVWSNEADVRIASRGDSGPARLHAVAVPLQAGQELDVRIGEQAVARCRLPSAGHFERIDVALPRIEKNTIVQLSRRGGTSEPRWLLLSSLRLVAPAAPSPETAEPAAPCVPLQ